MKSNIVLIGMPGAGKSTVGVVLAKLLGMSFTDTDLLIQERYGKKLSDIIGERGKDGFLKAENAMLASLCCENTVVATGGSAVYGKEAMQNLSGRGTVVYLCVTLEEVASRLSDLAHRGVVLRDGETLAELYAERCPLYKKYADLTVCEETGRLEDTVRAVMKKLGK